MFKRKFRQLGQGMTEYIIIVALIAIAAIAIYGLFGDTIRGQMGVMTEELAGKGSASSDLAPDTTVDDTAGTLSTFADPTTTD
jgi:Flp pilus assembly pilin Flp